jgi:hypothetical protein
MSVLTKSIASGCLLPMLAAGAVALAQPAAASTATISCDNTSSHFMDCDLSANGLESQFTNQRWTIFTSSYTPADGTNELAVTCNPGQMSISVTYLDETGTPQSVSKGPTCRSGPSQ